MPPLSRILELVAIVVDRALGIVISLWFALIVTLAVLQLAAPLTGHGLVVIAGRSMEPTIPFGSLAVIEEHPQQIAPGDVITFATRNGVLVTHRVTAVSEDAFFSTAGDNNPDPDPAPVARPQVEGRMIFNIAWLGYALGILTTPLGLFSLLLALAAFTLEAFWVEEDEQHPSRPATTEASAA